MDGLCSLYAAIHSLRLALADYEPIGRSRCLELFEVGVGFLGRKMELEEAIVLGVGIRRRTALVRHLARAVSTSNCQLEVHHPNYESWSSIADVFGWIEGSIAQGMPVLVTLTGGLDHHTVVAGATPTTLQLFDSGGHRFLRKASCGLREGYHRIPPKGLLRIAVHRRD